MRKIFLVFLFWGVAAFMLLAKWPVRQIAEAINYQNHPDAAVALVAGWYVLIIVLGIVGASVLSRHLFGRYDPE
ncbi:MAG: hypothetical protein M1338_01425 [Patescibacteria group bacterium]|nr:hypothetical protein [Patescibacteria group bacterium]